MSGHDRTLDEVWTERVGRQNAIARLSAGCDDHTDGPAHYNAWHEWAERRAKTHVQTECPGCGLWMIWTPKVPT